MGLNVAMFDASGDLGRGRLELLRHRTQPGFADLGTRCVLFTIGDDRGVVDDLGIEVVDEPEQADFLFTTGLQIPPLTSTTTVRCSSVPWRGNCQWSAPTPTGWPRRAAI